VNYRWDADAPSVSAVRVFSAMPIGFIDWFCELNEKVAPCWTERWA